MEGAKLVFASGMAAVYSTMAALLKSGDHIVSSSSVFEQLIRYELFPKWNIETPISTSTNRND
jgi:O-succinylhomoserine sulfhydrylase